MTIETTGQATMEKAYGLYVTEDGMPLHTALLPILEAWASVEPPKNAQEWYPLAIGTRAFTRSELMGICAAIRQEVL